MNKNKKRLFCSPNPILRKDSEKAKVKNQKLINKYCRARIKYLCQKLISLKPKPNKKLKTDKQYYQYLQYLEKLIFLCQKGFWELGLSKEDNKWVKEGLTCLIQLYNPFIINISNNFVKKFNNQIDFDDVNSYAQRLFIRLVTGDTPWAIDVFKDEKKPTHETKATLSKINISKIKKETEKELDSKIKRLEKLNLHPEDIKLTKYLFQEDLKTFSEWINQPTQSFSIWVKLTLAHQIKIRQIEIELGLIKDKKRLKKFQIDILKLTKILKNKKMLQKLVKKNHSVFKKLYEEYKKNCYNDEKYTRYDNRGNFTVFIQQYLPRRLSDLYKRKELLLRDKISLEEIIDTEEVEKTDFSSNILAKESVRKLEALLTTTENKIFKYLYLKEWRQVDIAKRLKISKGRVSQLVKNIRQKARKLDFL